MALRSTVYADCLVGWTNVAPLFHNPSIKINNLLISYHFTIVYFYLVLAYFCPSSYILHKILNWFSVSRQVWVLSHFLPFLQRDFSEWLNDNTMQELCNAPMSHVQSGYDNLVLSDNISYSASVLDDLLPNSFRRSINLAFLA